MVKLVKKKNKKFIDVLGREWDDQLGDLSTGSKFILYGTELCTVLELDRERGPASVVYSWGKKTHVGLPPIKKNEAWHAERE